MSRVERAICQTLKAASHFGYMLSMLMVSWHCFHHDLKSATDWAARGGLAGVIYVDYRRRLDQMKPN